MEIYSDIFSFLIILKESIKLVSKNIKLIASITTLSLIVPSILLLLSIQFYQSLMDFGPDLAIFLGVEISFLIVYFAISHISGIATVLVSSASYTDKNLSLDDLISSIKRTWRKPLSTSFDYSRNPNPYCSLSYILFFVVLFTFVYLNILTISVAVIIVTVIVIFQLYSSVVWTLSSVISVVEESSAKEAMEKAGNLVKGNHMKGFMLNLFVHLVFLIVFGLVFMLTYYKGSSSYMTTYGLLFVNVFSIVKMVSFMAYTVLYFQCKMDRGDQEIELYGKSTSIVGDDIP